MKDTSGDERRNRNNTTEMVRGKLSKEIIIYQKLVTLPLPAHYTSKLYIIIYQHIWYHYQRLIIDGQERIIKVIVFQKKKAGHSRVTTRMLEKPNMELITGEMKSFGEQDTRNGYELVLGGQWQGIRFSRTASHQK